MSRNTDTETSFEPLTDEVWQAFFRGDASASTLLNKLVDDRFVLQEVLGEGGMACTFKALDLQRDKVRAVKMPRARPGGFETTELLERFKREGEGLEELAHDYIVRSFDHKYDSSGQTPVYLVMEYIAGGTLAERLQKISEGEAAPFTSEQVADIVEKLGVVFQYLHKHNLLHRDIKPDNIMLREQDGSYDPVLIDLGILKDLRQKSSLTTTQAPGAVRYMSPEQRHGERELTPASDQYQLAVTIRDLVLNHNGEGGSPYISGLKPYQWKLIHRILKRAQREEPSERYPTVAEMTSRIAGILRAEQSVVAKYGYMAEAAWYDFWRALRKKWRESPPVVLAGLGGVVLSVVVLGLLIGAVTGGDSGSGQVFVAEASPSPTWSATAVQVVFPTAGVTATSPAPPVTVIATMFPTATASETPIPATATPTASPTATPTASPTMFPTLPPTEVPTLTPTALPSPTPSPVPTSAFDLQDVYMRLKVQARSINHLDCEAYHALISEIAQWARVSTDELAADVKAYLDDSESGVMVVDRYCQEHPNENLPPDLRYAFSELQDFVALFERE